MGKGRGLMQWWVYLAAVPLAEGRTAFRLGRSLDPMGAIKQVQDSCPLRIAKLWVLATCSERAARAALKGLTDDLAAYFVHGSWVQMQTDRAGDKGAMRHAMEAARQYGIADEAGGVSPWRSVDIRAKKVA